MKGRPSLGAVALAMVFGAALALAGVKQAAWREASLWGSADPAQPRLSPALARADLAVTQGFLLDAARELDAIDPAPNSRARMPVQGHLTAAVDDLLEQAQTNLHDEMGGVGTEEARRLALLVLQVRPNDVAAKRIVEEADRQLVRFTTAAKAKLLFVNGKVAEARALAEGCALLEPACAELVPLMKRFEKQYERLKELSPAEAKELVALERTITGGDLAFAETVRQKVVGELVRRGALEVAGEHWPEANQAVSVGLELAPEDGRLNALGRDLQKNGAQLMARAVSEKKTHPRRYAELMRRLEDSVPEPYLSQLKVGIGDDAL